MTVLKKSSSDEDTSIASYRSTNTQLYFQSPTSDLHVGTVSPHRRSVETTSLWNISAWKLRQDLTHPPDDLRRLEGYLQRPVLDLHVLAGTLVVCFDPIKQKVS